MRVLLILSCLFFVQFTQATVLHVNQNDSVVYFHPTPFLDLSLKEASGTVLGFAPGTLSVTLNYDSKMIQREFNALMAQYRGYEIKISPATNVSTVFTLDLPTVGIRKDFKLRQTNMGPFFSERITLNPLETFRFKNSKAAIEASVYTIAVRSSYITSVEVEKYEADPSFCTSIDILQVKDMIFAIRKIGKPASVQHTQTFESLKNSALRSCFELETSNVNSFAELLQTRVLPKPGGIARGSHSEKKPQELFFEIQPSVDVSETVEE